MVESNGPQIQSVMTSKSSMLGLGLTNQLGSFCAAKEYSCNVKKMVRVSESVKSESARY